MSDNSICARCNVPARTDAEKFLHALAHSGDEQWAKWGDHDKLNALPYIFWPIVARAMEEYKKHV